MIKVEIIHLYPWCQKNIFKVVIKAEAVIRRCSVKKGVLKNAAKFTGKHLCQSLFFNKVAGLRHATLF